MVSNGSIVVASKEQTSCNLSGEVIILNLKNGTYYGLNPVGSFIWNQIQVPKTFDQVKDAILANYNVPPDECERDLLELLNALSDNELAEIH